MPAPTDQRKIDVFAELLAGRPCIQAEAFRGAGISESTAKKLLKDEAFQAKLKIERRRHGSMVADARRILEDMVVAENDDGEPAYGIRKMAAELILKHGDILDIDIEAVEEETLPAGVVRVYPATYDTEEPAPTTEGKVLDSEYPATATPFSLPPSP